MMSRYINIAGTNYSASMIQLADDACGGDRTKKMDDSVAESLFESIIKDNRYSDLEKRTLAYIRFHYNFSDAADEKLRTKIRSWSAQRAKKKPKKERTLQNFKEYINEETGERFQTIEDWASSIDYTWGLNDYINEYDCPYIIETLADYETIDCYSDYKRGYSTYLWVYRGCDGKLYGHTTKSWMLYDSEILVPFSEFEERQVVSTELAPKGTTDSGWKF